MKEKLILLFILIVFLGGCEKSQGDKIFLTLDPKINFTCNIDIPTKTVSYTNKSENLKNYTWYFGDGDTSKEKSPKHIYKSEGTFQVSLSATTLKSAKVINKSKKIVIGDPEGHKPMVSLYDYKNLDFAGFTIKWTRKNPHTPAILNLQIANDELFENIVREKEVSSYTKNMDYKATDLNIKTKYWYRMQIKYIESTKEEIYYSDTRTATTEDMPKPFAVIVPKPTSGSFSIFEVNTRDVMTNNNNSEIITHKLQLSRDKDFTKGFEAKNTCVFKKYFKEPKTKFYARYTATYKKNVRIFENSQEYIFNYIYSTGNGNGISGEYTNKYLKNKKTILEFGKKKGAKIIIEIKDFKGVGKYPLSYNSGSLISINTNIDSYAYYLDGKSNFKYYLNRKGISLDVYRETDGSYFCKIVSEDNYNNMIFKQLISEVENYGRYTIYDPFFTVIK
ncbi:MAG: PKD domain-containing protein [Marinifilaceae bacterium]